MKITVGIRDSKLSYKQFEEFLALISSHHIFTPIPVKTIGDIQQHVSLRDMDKTDFFTKNIDDMQLAGKCRISVHAAKDLPDPLPNGLVLAALTHGQDPSDSLVFRDGESLDTLPVRGKVGSSSQRRDEAVKQLRSDLLCIDIRGTIERRLEKLFRGEIDALILAEAALIRLEIMHLNRITLPGETAPLQGKLAVIARKGDEEMMRLCASIDSRLLNPGKKHVSNYPLFGNRPQ